MGSCECSCCIPIANAVGQEEEEQLLLQHPRMNLLKDKPEPQNRSGAESPEFGAVGKLG